MSQTPDDPSNTRLADDPDRRALNTHGFGFQYAVIEEIYTKARVRGFDWKLVGAEVPISLNGEETHADFLFFSPNKGAYLVGECKRADPALGRWCFARSKYHLGSSCAAVDVLHFRRQDEDRLYISAEPLQAPAYQVGIAVKRPKVKGDGNSGARDAISRAASQVLRATNGFIELCGRHPSLVRKEAGGRPARFVPVVVSTAEIVAGETDLSLADLASGDLPSDFPVAPKSWVWFQHALNESMQANVPGRFEIERFSGWRDLFAQTALRSVAFINSGGVGEFLDTIDNDLP